MKSLTEAHIQFLTADKVNVTENIKKGKTQKFTCRKEAEDHARNKRSYVYDLFYFTVQGTKNTEVKPFGYAVPK